jgi:hypothetical protein
MAVPAVGGVWERIQPTLEDVFVSVIGAEAEHEA